MNSFGLFVNTSRVIIYSNFAAGKQSDMPFGIVSLSSSNSIFFTIEKKSFQIII